MQCKWKKLLSLLQTAPGLNWKIACGKKELKTQKNDFMDSLNKNLGKVEQELTDTERNLENTTRTLSGLS